MQTANSRLARPLGEHEIHAQSWIKQRNHRSIADKEQSSELTHPLAHTRPI